MFRCTAYGLVLDSGIPLPELPPCANREADLAVRLAGAGEETAGADREGEFAPLHYDDPADPFVACRRHEGALTLRFRDHADFTLSADGRSLVAAPRAGLPAETLRHFLLDTVLPLLLTRRGHLVLHGSGVATAAGAAVFVGYSGCGKSTLALSLLRAGARLLGDDAVVVDAAGGDPRVVPAYPGLRLWPDAARSLGLPRDLPPMAHYAAKVRVGREFAEEAFAAGAVPVGRVYLLSGPPADRFAVEPLPPDQALLRLLECSFRLDPEDREGLRREFETLSGHPLLSRVRLLTIPAGWDRLPEVVRGILQDAG